MFSENSLDVLFDQKPARSNGHAERHSAYVLQVSYAEEPEIHIKVGRNPVLHLSVAEARLVRDFIDALLDIEVVERGS